MTGGPQSGHLLRDAARQRALHAIEQAPDGVSTVLIARWESVRGRWWLELEVTILADRTAVYGYSADRAGGSFGPADFDGAYDELTWRVERGYYQPDANVTPMRPVALDKAAVRH